MAFGSNDAVASIAAMVIAAEAISRSDQSFLDNLIKQPIFFFAQGDEWGSMGSNRFVDDILDFQCRNPIPSPEVQGANELPACADPIYLSTLFQEIKIENIDSVVAIDQVGLADESEDQSPFFYLHPSSTNELNVSMVESLAVTLGIQLSSDFNDFHSSPLPPTPLSAFLRNPAVGSHIKGFVIAGYDQHFVDNAHHSRFDTPSRISLEKIITYVT